MDPNNLASTDLEWADRCRYWLTVPTKPKRKGPPRRREHLPLVLAGHGMSLRVDHGALVVRGGFTHFPQEAEEFRFFRGERNLPSRIVVLDGSGILSFDVLSWLLEQNVPLIRINWRGEVSGIAGVNAIVVPERALAQLTAQRYGRALPFAISLIQGKLRNSVATLASALPETPATELAISKQQELLDELKKRPPKSIKSLLGIEGRAAFAYFNAWQKLPLRWKGTGRHPIPKDWNSIGQRQSFARIKGRNRNATHPVNAILNYAYAILESQIRIQVSCEGYDPKIGFMHASASSRDAFVLDLMEPMRPIVDRRVLEFVQANTFHPADFTILADGLCRLNPEMARRIVRFTAIHSQELMHSSPLVPASRLRGSHKNAVAHFNRLP